jgi:hypothetical protein
MPPVITFSPEGEAGESNGTQIFEEGVERCRTRDEEAQGWDVEERPVGQESHEPQAGDCDRTFGGKGQGQKGTEEGLEEAEDREEKDYEEKDWKEIEAVRWRSRPPPSLRA